MTFIITLISLVIERFFHWSHLRQWRWFTAYQRWLSNRIANWPSWTLLIICILPPMIVVGVVNGLLDGWWYGILKLIFGVIVLIYCLGPSNLWVQVYACLSDLHKEDPKIAIERAQTMFGLASPENSQAFHQAFTRAIFINAHERIFAVVFWFVILGPVGAVMYRAVAICAEKSDLGLTQLATTVQRLLDWLPVRIFTILFALGGHFEDVFQVWKKNVFSNWNANDTLLTESGIAALAVADGNRVPEDGAAEKGALDLLDRVFVMSLVILAMIVLIIK